MDTPNGVDRLPDGPVRRIFNAAGQHNLDAMMAEFADDYVNTTPNHPSRSFTGSAQVRSNWSALFAGIPDLSVEVSDAATGTDGKVWVEWGSHGTRRDGTAVEQAGVGIFSLRGNQVAAVRFYLEPVDQDAGDVNAAVRAIAGTGSEGALR
ncbi:MAG: nuclear transport factor 2 family protein [Arthrobacter sp.]|uniref:nuclear transport factor 2 family protein n=1 Tax=Pseudarthrobacter defluvii TaxID=410837 RepID=UPI002576A47E|nr:nuclear transport factor 2 family protein [Pseudarthrobacter defluvii]WJH23543.1 nuclear transport factor 2 family protein [Pseudarthrobacter defluvii]